MIKLLLKPLIKILTDPKLIELLDKNGDGKVSWKEIKTASTKTKLEITGSVLIKYVPFLLAVL